MNNKTQRLAEAFLNMLNTHDPDLVDTFVATEYRNHNFLVPDGREANREFWAGFFAALPDLTATRARSSTDAKAGRSTIAQNTSVP